MNRKSTFLFYFYIFMGFLALALTWAHVPTYFGLGFFDATLTFWTDALFNSNPAGKFLTVDVIVLAFVLNVWMVKEGRRLGLTFIWAYILGGVFIAISFSFPLFLAARERQLSLAETEVSKPEPRVLDYIGLAMIGTLTLGLSVWVL